MAKDKHKTQLENFEDNKLVSVVHLIWIPYGIEPFTKFILSYCKYKSGFEHDLILLFNGVTKEKDIFPYLDIANENKLTYHPVIYSGFCQDIDAYFWISKKLKASYILFLNSHTELIISNWLKKYIEHIHPGSNLAIIGATGSWQSYYRSVFIKNTWKWEKRKSFSDNYKKYKLLLKALFYWRFKFPGFPNPHIRTNAFMIRRELLLMIRYVPLKNKFSAYEMESGKNSITNQIIKMGFRVAVLDRWDNIYDISDWPNSKTFWIAEQQNLLISDNQTRLYENANEIKKRKYTCLAWGRK